MSKTQVVSKYKMKQFIYLNKLREASKILNGWMEWLNSNPSNLDLGYVDI